MQHDKTRRRVLGATSALGLSLLVKFTQAQDDARVIAVSAKKFDYTPSRIELKLGEPVIFELISQDVIMGFNLPDFRLRTDIVPGKITRLRFTPDKPGKFDFYCDVFCGDGHEDMGGVIVIS